VIARPKPCDEGRSEKRAHRVRQMMSGAVAHAARLQLREIDKILGGSVSRRSFKSGYQDDVPPSAERAAQTPFGEKRCEKP
jgi:hypothetical protein